MNIYIFYIFTFCVVIQRGDFDHIASQILNEEVHLATTISYQNIQVALTGKIITIKQLMSANTNFDKLLTPDNAIVSFQVVCTSMHDDAL